ncbi:zinc ribbon domain-containing protein [Mycoplasma sp. Z244C]
MATNKDIEFLQQLNLDFESFKNSPFNMLKPFKIPKKLKTLMVEATEEEIYNTVLYSVYNACNSLINNVINIVKMKLENKADKFKECVGSERVELLSKAIFHEINYRFTTATTPELFNKLSVASNNIQVLGAPRDFYLAEQHLNPIARNFLEDGEWNLLGVELGKAYEKAIELDKKLEEFKEVLSKEITEAKNEANSIFKVLKTDYETRADDLYYKKWGKLTTLSESLVDKVTRAREEQEALLETNYKRLKNNADVNYDFYLNQIKERIKAFKSEIGELKNIDSLSEKVDNLEALCQELKSSLISNSDIETKLEELESAKKEVKAELEEFGTLLEPAMKSFRKEMDSKATKENLEDISLKIKEITNKIEKFNQPTNSIGSTKNKKLLFKGFFDYNAGKKTEVRWNGKNTLGYKISDFTKEWELFKKDEYKDYDTYLLIELFDMTDGRWGTFKLPLLWYPMWNELSCSNPIQFIDFMGTPITARVGFVLKESWEGILENTGVTFTTFGEKSFRDYLYENAINMQIRIVTDSPAFKDYKETYN